MSYLSEKQNLPMLNDSPSCCRWRTLMTPMMIAVTITSIGVAAYFAGRSNTLQARADGLHDSLPLLDASAAISTEKFSMATGNISDDGDGLFVLDHNSGLLQCNVIYPRMGKFMARFTVNVADTLGTGGKGGKYMMLTGRAEFRQASNRPAASTIVYVMDANTGNYACYGVPFDRSAMNANRPQQGLLVPIATGVANPVIDRDNLR